MCLCKSAVFDDPKVMYKHNKQAYKKQILENKLIIYKT